MRSLTNVYVFDAIVVATSQTCNVEVLSEASDHPKNREMESLKDHSENLGNGPRLQLLFHYGLHCHVGVKLLLFVHLLSDLVIGNFVQLL